MLLKIFYILFAALTAAFIGAVVSLATAGSAPLIPVIAAMLIGSVLAMAALRSKGIRRMPSNPQIMLPLMFFILALPIMAFAQDGTVPDITSFSDALIVIIPAVVPILISLAKNAFYEKSVVDGKISWEAPKWLPKGLLPVVAVALGALISWIVGLWDGTSVTTIQGALLGGLSVFLREFFKPLTNKLAVAFQTE